MPEQPTSPDTILPDKPPQATIAGTLLRVALVFFLFILLQAILYALLVSLIGAALSQGVSLLTAALLASGVVLRIFESGSLAATGLAWTRASLRHLLLGLAGGTLAALLVVGLPLLAGGAHIEPDPSIANTAPSLLWVTVMLICGALGEEVLFRGYLLQVIARRGGVVLAIVVGAALFGLVHAGNEHANWFSVTNTAAWGVLLGVALFRSGDLWLATGLHFAWNWVLPLFGTPLSGFTLNTTGIALRWHWPDWVTGGEYGPEGGLLTTLALVPLALFLWRAPVRRQQLPYAGDRQEA